MKVERCAVLGALWKERREYLITMCIWQNNSSRYSSRTCDLVRFRLWIQLTVQRMSLICGADFKCNHRCLMTFITFVPWTHQWICLATPATIVILMAQAQVGKLDDYFPL